MVLRANLIALFTFIRVLGPCSAAAVTPGVSGVNTGGPGGASHLVKARPVSTLQTPRGWGHAGCREEDGAPSDGFLGYLIDNLGLRGPLMTLPCTYVLCVTLRVGLCCVQRDLGRLEKWASAGVTGLGRGKCRFLRLGGVNSCSGTHRV